MLRSLTDLQQETIGQLYLLLPLVGLLMLMQHRCLMTARNCTACTPFFRVSAGGMTALGMAKGSLQALRIGRLQFLPSPFCMRFSLQYLGRPF